MQSLFSFSGKRFFHKRLRKGLLEKTSGNGFLVKKGSCENIFNNEYVTISFDKESRVLYQEWRGFCPGAEFRAAVDFVLNFMTEENIYKTICDVRNQKVVPPSCQKYVEERVLSFIKNNGSFFTAFVALEKSAGGICAKLYDIHITQKLNYKINSFFGNISEAELWLREK